MCPPSWKKMSHLELRRPVDGSHVSVKVPHYILRKQLCVFDT